MRGRTSRLFGLAGLVIVAALVGGLGFMGSAALAGPSLQITATPLRVELPTASPTSEELVTSTPTRTPTLVGPALAEALEGETNVRAAPDIEAERLGQIVPGEFYPVLGRAAGTLWLKIQYPGSPTGTAWVFEQVVSLTGNVDQIPELEAVSVGPTIDAAAVAGTQTIEAIALTPGALATATAEAIIFGAALNGSPLPPTETQGPLPTYTFPPTLAPQSTAAASRSATATDTSGMPPIVPILALAGLGSLGLLISLLRRAA